MVKTKIVQFLKSHKRQICVICLILAFLAVFSVGIEIVSAEGEGEDTTESNEIKKPFIPVPRIPGTPTVPGTTAVEKANYLIGKVFENVRYLLAAVAIAMIILSGFKLVTSQGKEETITKQKSAVIWWLLGLTIILLVKPFIEIFEVAGGGIFTKQKETIEVRINILVTTTSLVITYMKYVVGGLGVLFMVRSAYFLIISGDQEDIVTREKKNLGGIMIALVAIGISSLYINQVIYKVKMDNVAKNTGVHPYVDPGRGLQEIVGLTNFVVSFAGPLAILALMIGAILYITAAGEEDKMNKAKNILKASIIGLIVIYSAYAIVTTFVAGSFEGVSAT